MSGEGLTDRIRQALEGITPGPWKWSGEEGGYLWLEAADRVDVLSAEPVEWGIGRWTDDWTIRGDAADRALIAAAPSLLAEALERIEQLERKNAAYGRTIDSLRYGFRVEGSVTMSVRDDNDPG